MEYIIVLAAIGAVWFFIFRKPKDVVEQQSTAPYKVEAPEAKVEVVNAQPIAEAKPAPAKKTAAKKPAAPKATTAKKPAAKKAPAKKPAAKTAKPKV
jgi:DNA topoisomerase I